MMNENLEMKPRRKMKDILFGSSRKSRELLLGGLLAVP